MSSLSPEARKLMENSRSAGGPTSAQRAAMRNAVLGAVLVPTAAAATATATASTGATVVGGVKATGLALALKLSVVVVSVAVGATVTWKGVAPAAPVPEVAPVVVAARPAVVVPPPPEPMVEAPEVAEEVAPAPAPVVIAKPSRVEKAPVIVAETMVPPPPAPVVAEDPTLSQEVAALAGAMGAVDNKQFGVALQQLQTYRAAFPTGALETEASVLEVLALCGLNRVDEARAAAKSLPANNPAVRRLERSCIAGTPLK